MSKYQDIIGSVRDPNTFQKRALEVIKEIEGITKRRLLVYVANFNHPSSQITFEDKTGFSDLIEEINEQEIDILVNSPGGFAEVTEALVTMLRSKFSHIRFAIPNMAKSAATLLCLSGNQLLMDHRSELGPTDPQISYPTNEGMKREAAEDIIDGVNEVRRILKEEGPEVIAAYVPLLSKYTMGLLRGCENARNLSRTLSRDWLRLYMFSGQPRSRKPHNIKAFFSSRAKTLSHTRAIGIEQCIKLGLKVIDLRKEENKQLGSKLWELWCLYELNFERAVEVYKIYQNSSGLMLTKSAGRRALVVPPGKVTPKRKS
jgi:hypothetical protein